MPTAQRVLYLAHESGPMCVSVLDVSHPEQPTIITQFKVEAPNVRCNSLGLAGNTLVVAHQTEKVAEAGAGIDMYDIADPKAPKKLAHFDTSGPHSRGVHFVWFTDGHYAYLSTGARDFTPQNKLDDQFLMIVDVAILNIRAKPGAGGCPARAKVTANRRRPVSRRSMPASACTRWSCRRKSRIVPMSAGSMAAG